MKATYIIIIILIVLIVAHLAKMRRAAAIQPGANSDCPFVAIDGPGGNGTVGMGIPYTSIVLDPNLPSGGQFIVENNGGDNPATNYYFNE